jgi:alpha-1,3-rhamnosyltransferase
VTRDGKVPEGQTVSVIVPSFNHARFIARCLRSIIRQSQEPLELIVIDDGSEDDSVRKIEQELKDCSFHSELIARNHKGLVQTLNEGLNHSRGKYFAYLGSDDIWLPEFLAARVKLLESRSNAVLAYGHCFVINEEDQILECTKDWAPYADGCAREMLLNVTVPFSPSVLYRRQILERHHWNENARLEDYDLYIRLSSEGEFAFDENIFCAWRSHGRNNSQDLEFMLRECLEAQRRAVPILKLTPKELKKANARMKWRYGGDFIKAGNRAAGIKLLGSNLKGAPSYGSVARMIGTLILPTPILRWRKQYLQRRMKSYGSLNELSMEKDIPRE